MNRKILLVAHLGSFAMISAVAEVLASVPAEEDVEIIVEQDRDNELLYGDGTGRPMGLLGARAIESRPMVAAPDFREYIPTTRPGKNPERHRPRDQYNRKQGWKPR